MRTVKTALREGGTPLTKEPPGGRLSRYVEAADILRLPLTTFSCPGGRGVCRGLGSTNRGSCQLCPKEGGDTAEP